MRIVQLMARRGIKRQPIGQPLERDAIRDIPRAIGAGASAADDSEQLPVAIGRCMQHRLGRRGMQEPSLGIGRCRPQREAVVGVESTTCSQPRKVGSHVMDLHHIAWVDSDMGAESLDQAVQFVPGRAQSDAPNHNLIAAETLLHELRHARSEPGTTQQPVGQQACQQPHGLDIGVDALHGRRH